MNSDPFETMSPAPGVNIVWTAFRLNTPRLLLRPVCRDDIEAILQFFTAETTRYMVPKAAGSQQEVAEYIHRSEIGLAAGTNLQVAILSTDNNEFLGCCGLHKSVTDEHPEIGIWIKAPAHGCGFGREAVAAVLDWSSKNLNYQAVLYPADIQNIASRRLAEKLGGSIVAQTTITSGGGFELKLQVYQIPLPCEAS